MERKIDKMHKLFGVIPSKKCKDCKHLKGGVNEYRKCWIYGCTSSASSDWNLSYIACGMFNRDWDGDIPIIKLNRGVKKQEEQIEGQMSFL